MPLPSVSPFAIYSDTLRAYALLAPRARLFRFSTPTEEIGIDFLAQRVFTLRPRHPLRKF